jgi:fructose-1,6-bisphosphatase/inositol monophosphatase family enzyme
MRRLIKANFPQHGIVGEEFGSEREDAEYVWVLDPIDGTKSFIAGFPIWGTLIALLHKGTPVFGMMHQPYIGERFSGDSGSAHYSGPSGERKLTVRRCASLKEATSYTTSPLLMNAADREPSAGSKRGEADALWRRLLFLLHAGGRPSRPRGRDRTEAL